MNPTVQFLTALGQALATMSLYAPAHPMRTMARQRVLETLHAVLGSRGSLRISFLEDEVIVSARALPELRGWDWGPRFARAGVQRLEVEATPLPSDGQLDELLHALHERLAAPGGTAFPAFVTDGLRAGPLAVASESPETTEAVVDLMEALAHEGLDEEAAAVRWIHDEAACGRGIPMAEVEAVVRALASAMHRDQHVVLPLLELKTVDQYTTTHSCNVAMLSMGLAERVGLSSAQVREIGTAALLHDIGKVRVPPAILVKSGKLTADEFQRMRQHPVDGARMLSERGRGHDLAAIVAYEHHIWEDGVGGYPAFTFPRRCHYASRLVHVCDLYDALSTKRPYRDAWPRARTLDLLQSQAGREVDREMVHAFVALANEAEETRLPLRETAHDDWTASVTRAAEALPESAASDTVGPINAGTIPHR